MFFRRKQKEPEQSKEIKFEHQHIWKDYPWYIEATYSETERALRYKIIENYVCIQCKERKEVILQEYFRNYLSRKEATEIVASVEDEFKNEIKPRVVVEDMINDDIHVDRERLKIWEKLKQITEENNHNNIPTIQQATKNSVQVE